MLKSRRTGACPGKQRTEGDDLCGRAACCWRREGKNKRTLWCRFAVASLCTIVNCGCGEAVDMKCRILGTSSDHPCRHSLKPRESSGMVDEGGRGRTFDNRSKEAIYKNHMKPVWSRWMRRTMVLDNYVRLHFATCAFDHVTSLG
jgi:hypothetical protein